jgi:hypothetical protein
MFVDFTDHVWLALEAIQDRGFQRGFPQFSRIGPNGQRQINVYWLYPWALSDECGNPRFFVTAVAIRTAWPDYAQYNQEIFLPEARRRRYL